MFMLAYKIIRAANRAYPFVVFWIYVVAFLTALPLMFIFPPGTLVLLWMALLSLVFFVALGKILRVVQHGMANRALSNRTCPGCGERFSDPSDRSHAWRCDSCGAVFEPGGAEQDQRQQRAERSILPAS
jgi:ribosomal protein L37AE/L43A